MWLHVTGRHPKLILSIAIAGSSWLSATTLLPVQMLLCVIYRGGPGEDRLELCDHLPISVSGGGEGQELLC